MNLKNKAMPAPQFLAGYAKSVEQSIREHIDARLHTVPEYLLHAMSYALLAGGKRIRPALLLTCFKACGGSSEAQAMQAAVSIECMHTYSLIHDDLPCMDDDDLRRGQATCHKQFDEATAVLAGDALQCLAFEFLTTLDVSSDMRVDLLHRLTLAAGAQGMVGGQTMDMQAEVEQVHSVLEVERIHIHKTGALIRYSCEAGGVLAGASEQQLAACSRYGEAVGLLFQIADDILDATASSEALGKSAGKDEAQHKATYVSLEGLQRARELAQNMQAIALESCEPLGEMAQPLIELADYILERGQ
ncbi:MAG: polyprenyl synthetase family protein [Mariprofundaceae bacterium]|nr:polyprenyl synthetase family protein [Mariprofundaceae bacterium]